MFDESRSPSSPEKFAPEKSPIRIPGVIDERSHTLPFIEEILKKAGQEKTADALKKIGAILTGEIPQTKSWPDILGDIGESRAAETVKKAADSLGPQYVSESEKTSFKLSPQEIDTLYQSSFEKRPDGETGESTKVFTQSAEGISTGLPKRETPVSNTEFSSAIDGEAAESGEALPKSARFAKGEDPFEGTTVDTKSAESRLFEAVTKLRNEFGQAIETANGALIKGDVKGAIASANKLLEQVEAAGLKDLPAATKAKYAEVKAVLAEAVLEDDTGAQKKLYKLAADGADFIPVIGPGKMMVEAAIGKTLGGETLKGWKRFLHGTEGLVFTAVDLTGYGVVATKLAKAGKGSMLGAKLITRSAALMRVLKVPRSVYRPVFNTGRFLIKHPRLGAAATYGLNAIIAGRKIRLKDVITGKQAKSSAVADRAGMQLDTWA